MKIILPCALILAFGSNLSAQTLDNFETYTVAVGGAELTGAAAITDTTVTGTGQGPNLVADGCTYTTSGTDMQWNGDTYFGLVSKTLLGNGPTFIITYDSPTANIDLTLHAFNGFGDNVNVNLYDLGGALISSTLAINVPDASAVSYSYSGATVARAELTSTVWSWGPIIDNHQYDGGAGGGLTLAVSGTCPGNMTISVTGATPGNPVAIVHGPAGTFTVPGGSCAGLTLGISGPTLDAILTADGAGNVNVSPGIPGALCGSTMQAVDILSCTVSNAIVL